MQASGIDSLCSTNILKTSVHDTVKHYVAKYGCCKLLCNIGYQTGENYLMNCVKNGDPKWLVAIGMLCWRLKVNDLEYYLYENILDKNNNFQDNFFVQKHGFFTTHNALFMKNVGVNLWFTEENPFANTLCSILMQSLTCVLLFRHSNTATHTRCLQKIQRVRV